MSICCDEGVIFLIEKNEFVINIFNIINYLFTMSSSKVFIYICRCKALDLQFYQTEWLSVYPPA